MAGATRRIREKNPLQKDLIEVLGGEKERLQPRQRDAIRRAAREVSRQDKIEQGDVVRLDCSDILHFPLKAGGKASRRSPTRYVAKGACPPKAKSVCPKNSKLSPAQGERIRRFCGTIASSVRKFCLPRVSPPTVL